MKNRSNLPQPALTKASIDFSIPWFVYGFPCAFLTDSSCVSGDIWTLNLSTLAATSSANSLLAGVNSSTTTSLSTSLDLSSFRNWWA